MLIAFGLWAFRVGWNARIVAMLLETAMVGVLAISALIVQLAPEPVGAFGVAIPGRLYLFLLLVAELGALSWGRRAHRRAAAHDPAVAAFYQDEDDADAITDDHARIEREILDTLTGAGAAPKPAAADAPEGDKDAIAAIAAPRDPDRAG